MGTLYPDAGEATRTDMCMFLYADLEALTVGQAEMLEAHLDIVDAELTRLLWREPHHDAREARSVGYAAMVDAMRGWDIDLGEFRVHARVRVRRALVDMTRRGQGHGVKAARDRAEQHAARSGAMFVRPASLDPQRATCAATSGTHVRTDFIERTGADAEQSAERAAESLALAAAILQLTPRQQALVRAVYLEGRSVTQWAQGAGVSARAAYRLRDRALGQLRRLMGAT